MSGVLTSLQLSCRTALALPPSNVVSLSRLSEPADQLANSSRSEIVYFYGEEQRLNLAVVPPESTDVTVKAGAQRTLLLSSLVHALHDGFTDMIYVLLPVWQAEFALDYVALAVLRASYVGVLAALQVPSAHLARHLNARTVLVLFASQAFTFRKGSISALRFGGSRNLQRCERNALAVAACAPQTVGRK